MIIIKNKKKITNSDIETIAKLEQEIFPDNFFDVNDLENLFFPINFYCLFFEHQNTIIGYCLFFENNLEAEIYKIGVLKKYQKQKIGSKMLDFLKNNYQSIHIEVSDKDNKKEFYLKNDFAIIYKRNKYYTDESNAIVMKWEEK
ncbi:MAG: GNAT family N-acetyltransferase [Malacoplasma sp.]|nr:GNAT family N-acetyltransferase [Malacoplasma sp.]